MATYAIGDLQGCFEPLERLLATIAFNPSEDFLWFAGDIVNRGPNSLACLQKVKSLCEAGSAAMVLGNHDLHLLGVASGFRHSKRGDTLQDILDSPERFLLIDWLRRQPWVLSQTAHLLCHAGLPF